MKPMRVTYYVAICVFLLCLLMIVVKMTFWPVCVGSTACDGWTVAGLTAAILGAAAAFLGILGAILLAAWWTGLDKRVEARVAEAFSTQIQAVKSTIDQQVQAVAAQFKETQDSMRQFSTQAATFTASIQAQEEQMREQVEATRNQVQQMREAQGQLETLQAKVRQKVDELEERTEQLRNLMATTDVRAALIQKPESTPHSADKDHNSV